MKRHLAAVGEVMLTDGALGTEYQKLGLAAGHCADFWTLEAPDRVLQVTRSYVDAGSQAVLTTTFRANRITLADYGRAGDVVAINRAAVAICREAAAGKALVLGSVGPTGKMLITGEVSEADLALAFAEQCEALAGAGVDAIILETFSDLAEASIGLSAARNTGVPAIVSFAFDTGRNNDRTMMGVTPEEAARKMTDAGAYAVGANCGVGFDAYVNICSRLRAATPLPVWIKPNAGLPEIVEGRAAYRSMPADFAFKVPAYIDAGANFIGGCCGTTPEFIRAAAELLNHRSTAAQV
jgi:methionine synthase I (cobalamin-dependent)